MGRVIRFIVYGEARPESKRTAPARPGKDGKIIQGRRYEPADRRDWKADVRRAASRAVNGPPLEGPVFVTVRVMKPPSNDTERRWQKLSVDGTIPTPTKGNAWPWAAWKKPDKNNLVKPVEDACKSVVWLDDGQIVGSAEWKIIGDRHATMVEVREVAFDEVEYQRAVMAGVMCELAGGCGVDSSEWADAIMEGLVDEPEAELDDEDTA